MKIVFISTFWCSAEVRELEKIRRRIWSLFPCKKGPATLSTRCNAERAMKLFETQECLTRRWSVSLTTTVLHSLNFSSLTLPVADWGQRLLVWPTYEQLQKTAGTPGLRSWSFLHMLTRFLLLSADPGCFSCQDRLSPIGSPVIPQEIPLPVKRRWHVVSFTFHHMHPVPEA